MPQLNVELSESLIGHLRKQVARSRRTLQAEVEIALENHLELVQVWREDGGFDYRVKGEVEIAEVDDLFKEGETS